jgi:hypothetical protein
VNAVVAEVNDDDADDGDRSALAGGSHQNSGISESTVTRAVRPRQCVAYVHDDHAGLFNWNARPHVVIVLIGA